MIWNSVKIQKIKNINKVKDQRLDENANDINLLLAYQRKVRGKFKLNENNLVSNLNYFKPQTKEYLKKNLIKFLAQNKSIKPKEYYRPPTPKKDMTKFYRDYQKDMLQRRVERVNQLRKKYYGNNDFSFDNLRHNSTVISVISTSSMKQNMSCKSCIVDTISRSSTVKRATKKFGTYILPYINK